MIPIRDVIPSRTRPWVTLTLIFLNLLIFAYGRALDSDARLDLFFTYGLVPADRAWPSLVTSLFLHTGWLQLVSNLGALWIFGENVEDRMGHARFFVFYLLCGVMGGLAGGWATPGVVVPIVGSGAAIAGLTGAYFVLFPHSRILVLLPLVVVIDVIEAPAIIIAAFWIVMQIAGDLGRIVASPGDSAFIVWTHVGGCLTGVLAVWAFRRRERLRVEWWSGTPRDRQGRRHKAEGKNTSAHTQHTA
jgi:membrane associated rhomboid family serine protease